MNGSSNTAKKQGTGFVNLQKMIGANKGNQLGSTIQQGVGNRVGQIKNQLGQQAQGFQSELQKNTLTDEAKTGALGTINKASTTPGQLTSDEISGFQGLLSGDYKGPMGLSNTAAVEAQSRELGQYGANVGSAAGRTNLLQRYAGGPKYTQGQQRVDNLLLGQTGGAALKDVRKQALGLESQVSNEKNKAQMAAEQVKQARKQFGQKLGSEIGRYDDPSTANDESTGAIGNLYKDVQNRTNTFNINQQQAFDAVKGIGDTNALTQRQIEALGLTEGQKLYDVNLGQYLRQQSGPVAAQQVANADDYAKYEALNKLAGRQGSFLTDKNMANSAKMGDVFDKDSFLGAVGARETDATNAQTQLSGLEAELNHRSQYTNDTRNQVAQKSPQLAAEFDSALSSGNLNTLASIIKQDPFGPVTSDDILRAGKLIEDQAPISQYRSQVENARNIYNSYNPNRILSLAQSKGDGNMTSGDPTMQPGGKGNWGGV